MARKKLYVCKATTMEEIAIAIREKLPNFEGTMTPLEMPTRIRQIKTGGASEGEGDSGTDGGLFVYLRPNETLWQGDESFTMQSDLILADEFSKDNFITTDNVASIERIDNLNFRVNFTHPIVLDEELSIKADISAYKYKNGMSKRYYKIIQDVELEDYINDKRHMIALYEGAKVDKFTSPSIEWQKSNGEIVTFNVDSEGVITIGGVKSKYSIGIDFSVTNCYYCFGHAPQEFVKIRWEGNYPYNNAKVNNIFEWFFFEDGNSYLNIIESDAIRNHYYLDSTNIIAQTELQQAMSIYKGHFYLKKSHIVYDKFDNALSKKRIESCCKIDYFDNICNTDFIDVAKEGITNYPSYYGVLYNTFLDGNGSAISMANMPFEYELFTSDKKATKLKTFCCSGDKIIKHNTTANNNTTQTCYSYRDGAIWYLSIEYVKIKDMGNLRALKIHWKGSSNYADKTNLDDDFEVYMFENGDGMMVINTPTTRFSAKNTRWQGWLLDDDKIKESNIVSCYKTYDEFGQPSGWEFVYDRYNVITKRSI